VLAVTESLTDLIGWQFVVSLPGIVLVAFLAGRLLGVRRSAAATVLSGIAGWIAGVALSIAIAEGQTDRSAGFNRNVWVFSAVFTMSAAVWVELLAKPGAMARAQTGLAGFPRPLKSLRRRARRVARYAQITRVAARHGLAPALGLARGRGGRVDGGGALPVRLRRALEECGGMFVKLGQVLSTRPDLVSAEVATELSRLQDHVATVPREEMAEVLEHELGVSVEEVFAEFDWSPIAAASIGQAYRARLPDGQAVVVKVQRPGIADAVDRDLDVLAELARAVEERTSWGAEYGVVDLAAEFAEHLREELDFRVEARNATEIAAHRGVAGDPIRIPEVKVGLSTTRVLVMEWLDGVSVRDTAGVDAVTADRSALADGLLRSMLGQMLADGEFHADPHPGNVMVLGDGHLGLIDFGAAARLDAVQQAAMRELMIGVARRDPEQLRQAVLRVATVRQDVDDDQLERALARFMTRHLASGTTPSAAMFNDLLQLFFSFGIRVAPELSTFFRALVTLDGTLAVLAPGYATIEAAQSVAAEWARETMRPGTVQEIARDELLRVAPILRRLPRHIDRLATAAERGNLRLRVRLFSDADDTLALTQLVNRFVLAFLGGVVGVLSVILLGTGGGPDLTGSTSLFQFFGYFGLFCATVLILRVVVAVARDGVN
jgi:ubiquinone biosynthesis protein